MNRSEPTKDELRSSGAGNRRLPVSPPLGLRLHPGAERSWLGVTATEIVDARVPREIEELTIGVGDMQRHKGKR